MLSVSRFDRMFASVDCGMRDNAKLDKVKERSLVGLDCILFK